MTTSIKTLANELGANKFLIAGNGSFVYDIQNEEILYSNYLEKQKILEIIKICDENSIFYNIYTSDMMIAKSINYNISYYNNENKKLPADKKMNLNITEDIYNYIETLAKEDFLKVTVCDVDKIIFSGVMRKLKKIKDVDVLNIGHISRKIIKSGTKEEEIAYFYTEITNKDVNKWTAIQYLMEKLNIKQEETMAIGDNINDKKMLEGVTMGVAMGNSCPEVKQVAKNVTLDNNNSGVARGYKQIRKQYMTAILQQYYF